MENAVSLSIIVVASRTCAALEQCLQWLLQAAQTIPDIEILLFASAIPLPLLPPSPCLRIRHIPQSCPEGYLRNCALDAAKGRYVIFIDPRRELNVNFLDVAAMTDFASDLVFLGCEVEKDGFAEYSGPNTGALSLGEALVWLLENNLGHYGKMYNLSFLRAQNLRFAEDLDGSDAAFAAGAMLRARAIAALNVSVGLFWANEEAGRTAVAEARAISALWQALQNYPPEYLEPVRNKLDGQLEQWLLPACRDDAAAQVAAKACMDTPLLARAVLRLARRMQTGLSRQLPGKKRAWRPTADAAPLVSVIVPVYNQENWIGRCLDSVLTQSLRGLEVIVIDDASTDGTFNVCQDYARRDGRVRLLGMKRNRGQGHCRNVGMAASRGRFITFVDSDDYILPGFLLSAAAQLLRNPEADCIQFGKALPDGANYSLYPCRCEITGRQMVELYLAEKMEYWECWGKVYRREFLAQGALRFARHLFEDEIFLLEAYAAANRLIIDPQPAYVYERKAHPDSAMAPVRWTHRHLAGFLARCAEVDGFMARHPELDKDGGQACRKLAKVYEYFRPLVLGYLAAKVQNGIAALDAGDLRHLGASPAFVRIFLEDYAEMYAAASGAAAMPAAPLRKSSAWQFTCNCEARPETTPAITFLVLARDCGQTLAACLASLVCQDNAEVLVVDAQSQDETAAICMEVAARHDNFAWFSAVRSMPDGSIWQAALPFAQGEYLLCLRGDETLAEGAARQWLVQLNGARPELWHLGQLPELGDLPPAAMEAGCEALLALFANAENWRLSRWALKRDFLLGLGRALPPAFACAYGFLPRVLLAATEIAWLDVAERPQRKEAQAAFRVDAAARMDSFLANAEYALGSIAQMEPQENGAFFAQKWLDAVCGGKDGMRGWLLGHIQANMKNAYGDGAEWLSEDAEIYARLAAMPQLLRWLFLDYARLWAASAANEAAA